jgi:anti-sigma-K factor RskA
MQPELQRAVFAGTSGEAAIAALCALRRSHDVGAGVDAMLAAHALGALDDSESRAVDSALVWDAAARRAFDEHLATVGDLALTGSLVAPPPRVWARIAASLDAV